MSLSEGAFTLLLKTECVIQTYKTEKYQMTSYGPITTPTIPA